MAIRNVVEVLLGRLDWQPPGWWAGVASRVDRFGAWARANRGPAAGAGAATLLLAALVLGGAWWWKTRPVPPTVAVTITAPTARDLNDPQSRPAPLLLVFGEPAAPIENVGKSVEAGVKLSPTVEGRWSWSDETTLRFEPTADWPVGRKYDLRLEPARLLRPGLAVAERHLHVRSAPFAASIQRAEFYQDPVDPQLKKVVVTLRFSHPVDPRSLEQNFSLRRAGGAGGLFRDRGAPLAFQASYDETRLQAYLHSKPLEMPEQASEVQVRLGTGVVSSLGGPALEQPLESAVQIPGRFSLAIRQASIAYATNERLESEQLLTLEPSEYVVPAELAGHLKAWLLPVHHPDTAVERRQQPFEWNTPALVADEVLALAEPLALEAVEPGAERPALHAFRFKAPPGRYLYVKVERGLKSFGGFELGKRHDATLLVPDTPREVKLLHSGALLPLRGERRLSLYSRDVPAIRYQVSRVLPERLHLLATQASGSFANPDFNAWSFSYDDLTERSEQVSPVAAAERGTVQYHGFDLTPYLAAPGSEGRGVFLVRAGGWDPEARQDVGAGDQRLVLVTDLGILVKKAVDGTEDVFVQSISSGEPVAGAVVQVIGRNGRAVAQRATDAGGRAALPSLRHLVREREPAMYLVRNGDDASFLPINRSDRGLDYSRFDVGGVMNATQAGQLSAYVFSDRGIYRPGDEMKFGLMVRASDWAQPLEGVPLEAIITDSRGSIVRRQSIRLGATGFEELAHRTSESSPTGAWTLSVYIVKDGETGQRLGATVVNVQEFLPDRLKLALRFSADREQGWVSPEGLQARLELRTLFDTPAADRRVVTTLSLSPRLPQFAAWKDYRFTDPLKANKNFEDTLPETLSSATGEASVPLRLERFDAGTYSLQVVARAFEPGGGRGVTQARTLVVSSLPFLVGMKPDGELGYVNRGARRAVSIVAVDPALKAKAVDGLRLELLERRYVSVLERQSDGTLRYESRLREKPLRAEPLALAAAAQDRVLATDAPGEFALVVREASGRELNRIEYSVAGAANVARRMDRNAELELRLARADYAPGEEIELSIRAPYAGAGLITIERERVHTFRWFRADTTSSVQRIRLPEDFDGNGYVTVTFVRDPNSAEIFASPLAHGVAPFSVNLDRRRLAVKLDAPERVRPGQQVELRYSAARPARLVLFGVDEGILQVAGWRTPDPLASFFEKRALEVETRQILDLILPEFRQLALAAPGGDAEGGASRYLNPFKRRRDPPVVFWSGIVDAGPEPRSFRYTVPDYFNGSMRIVAVAVAADAVGVATGDTVVKGDFVILPNAPVAVAPGDEFEFTAGVTNNLAGSGPAAAITTRLVASPAFELIGAGESRQSIAEGREGVVKFRLRARDTLGSGSLTLTASSGERRASISSTVSVRPAGVFQSRLTAGTLQRGAAEHKLVRSLRPEQRRLEATVSASPLALARGFEGWLADYPYGCTEQLVSQAVPAVVLAGRPELGRTNLAAGEARWARLLVELRARQTAEGGFGYWPGDGAVTSYPSVYALHMLVEAQQRGQLAPRDVLERGGDWLMQFAAGESGSLAEERARAYAIYVLTRMGRVASNFANAQVERLDARDRKAWRADITAAFLAAAYQNMRQSRLAAELAAGVRFAKPGAAWPVDDAEGAIGFHYDAAVHDLQLLYLLARHFPDRLRAAPGEALAAVASTAARERNTVTAAWGVLAIDAYSALAATSPAGELSITALSRAAAAKPLVLQGTLLRRATFGADTDRLRFGARGIEGPVFYTVEEAGYDRQPPGDVLSAGMEVTREYLDAAGKPVGTIRQGDELQVRLRFRSTGKRQFWDAVIVDVLPGGFEPVLDAALRGASATANGEAAGEGEGEVAAARGWYPAHVELREDRVIAFGAVGPRMDEFVYRVRATTAGSFTVPPAYAESMYDPAAQARSAASKVSVQGR